MAITPEQEASIYKFGITALGLLLAFIGYEFFVHEAGFFSGIAFCWKAFWSGAIALWGAVAGSIGVTAASVTLLSCVVIPVTTVSIYTIFRKVEDQPKAFITAIGLFLNPLFIDFFKDQKALEDRPIQKMLIASSGAVTFLIATSLWNRAARIQAKRRLRAFLARLVAIALFLLPSLCMVGYVAISAHQSGTNFTETLDTANIIGLIGLLITAGIGISFSRFYEAP